MEDNNKRWRSRERPWPVELPTNRRVQGLKRSSPYLLMR